MRDPLQEDRLGSAVDTADRAPLAVSDPNTILMAAKRPSRPKGVGRESDPAISQPAGLQALAVTARARGVELLTVNVHAPQELPPALASLRAGGAEGVNILSSPLFYSHRDQIGPLLLQHKLPAICEWREMTASGCLASYGTTLREGAAMQAALIDKMLKGARPGDTPAQQPTKFELVLNLKVAREIGVEIPPSILARADEVIE
jgi:putative tryptophan/tyrosine transport system substrate-binding protein